MAASLSGFSLNGRLPPLPRLRPLAGAGELVSRQDRSRARAECGGCQFHFNRHWMRSDLGDDFGGAGRDQVTQDPLFRRGTRTILTQLALVRCLRLPLGQHLSRPGVEQLEFGDDADFRIADLQCACRPNRRRRRGGARSGPGGPHRVASATRLPRRRGIHAALGIVQRRRRRPLQLSRVGNPVQTTRLQLRDDRRARDQRKVAGTGEIEDGDATHAAARPARQASSWSTWPSPRSRLGGPTGTRRQARPDDSTASIDSMTGSANQDGSSARSHYPLSSAQRPDITLSDRVDRRYHGGEGLIRTRPLAATKSEISNPKSETNRESKIQMSKRR